ncbi:Protein-glutamate methylesterase/protein-glutamine glutaminase [Vibrio stylophorae]|uniref:Protein-glutamate methylesterase/protein-glutamine glutaminase n=1 Tax=Vibrio stylophorae TaxID=659351 RepID=A0ABM8ZTY0_9VIBR|nr:response regulator [Vibrio stylophorae]CAH0533395.1 Protein-glutamate methylesterase/protein-glutamine glutaminase [Vibrio stylophorae]
MSYNPIVICDDSATARRALASQLPSEVQEQILFAKNGKQALDYLNQHHVEVMFLDLTMPEMDGFDVLSLMCQGDYDTKVVVVSGDVQREAVDRCMALGAFEFIKKPFAHDELEQVLIRLGMRAVHDPFQVSISSEAKDDESSDAISAFREVVNIAMGKGAAIISDHFGQYIRMPLPCVGMLDAASLQMAIEDIRQRSDSIAIGQRFVGGGIHGEALVCMRGKGIEAFKSLMGYDDAMSNHAELNIDVATVLVSAFLISLAEQIDVPFSLRQPVVLDTRTGWGGLSTQIMQCTPQFFTIEYTYSAESTDLAFEVLLLMEPNALDVIEQVMVSA